ncbi:E3 ubiquitin-protein ligase RNF34-like [Mizuhopecten yessoensis]|uniref:E3 ubiquitin-protein ligase RNF34 n=1 Tax=Mizuhopecten yessoensis TaxID=6573 RepID=A0A210Q838_MIZYE|nr:E3 ubiquitin-protein ligase RNF34-like [Mizuhopecten yessoensis]XP_021364768.1 E3 ubiquitin-protein ligase RNF34-like [Mizuhopecten yessoensis]XP_021364769.1 E3 ubiquitin-protein ligase RNF34-like [Mizuhopecten yessoensis]XP_021364770.1 E3 ubiquitin-protein ligase RNF34-like [Mizuhopecten yessoensis]XP_021364771.1 E3 ubiquitin-protein ligase RNF34-like [Mizuhopecten yessoensis]OWF44900.1 E3 ubiquitin-protein ligase RNF34 [Mizuhopecten yessoensis]
MGAAAVRGQNGTATFTFQSSGYTTNVNFNRGQQQSTAPNIMTCEACQTNFNLFKRKKICRYCDRNFCSSCVHRYRDPVNNRSTYRQCNTCKVLMSGKFTRSDLMKWKVKELRILLNKRNVSTNTCKEKHDLIDLLFVNFAKSPTQESAEVEDLESLSRQPSSLSGSTISSGGTQDTHNSHQPQGPQTPAPQQPTQPPAPESEAERGDRLRQRQEAEMRQAMFRQEIFGEEEDEEVPRETATPRVRMNLGQINSLEDVDNLTVRQLKEVLVTNFVNYKGCCEKPELVDRVKRLWREHKTNEQKVKDIDSPESKDQKAEPVTGEKPEDDICKICMDAAIDCVLLECGHMISCTQCGRRLNECPICRQYVVRVVHTFKS